MSQEIGYKFYCGSDKCGIHGYLFWDQMSTVQRALHKEGQMILSKMRCKACGGNAYVKEKMGRYDTWKKNQIRHRPSKLDGEAAVHGY
jgi:ribosomal protein L33|tara:strand:+ start:4289 stop:4552 length:264 start_codon:yes stop_codon:yes gene_type:complete